MKKRFLVVPLAVGAAGASWAGTTLYGGAEAREAYDRLLADAGEASGLTLVPESYEAGFLASEAVTGLVIGAGEDAVRLARFRHAIEHSPVGDGGLRAARIVTTLDTAGLDPQATAGLARLFGGATPLAIDSIIGLGGDAEHAVTVAAWSHDGPGGAVSSGAMEWTVRRDADGAFSGTGRWPGLTASVDAGEVGIVLGASHDRFDYRPAGDGLWVGEYAAELGELVARSDAMGGMTATLSGTSLSSTAEIVDALYRGNAELRVAAVDVPMVELDSMRLRGGFAGLPVAGLAKANGAAGAMAATFAGDEEAIEAALRSYLGTFEALLRPGARLDWGVELANAGGRALGDVAVSWTGGAADDGLAGIDTVGDLARAVRVSATLDVDADALARTPLAMAVDPAALAPWVVGDADGLRAEILVEDLVARVNGRAMPLEAFVGDALAMPLEEPFDGAI